MFHNVIVDKHADITKVNFLEGSTIMIDKPKNWTSFDVVNKIRFRLKHYHSVKKIKVGHAGTLDPLATGLLIICTGKFTKRIEEFQCQDKVYKATMKLGATTISDDAEHPEENLCEVPAFTLKDIEDVHLKFTGAILQKPPIFSAIKKNGTPLYKLARKGQKPKVDAREVTVHSIVVKNIRLPFIEIEVVCSKGTYIRSLVRDIGNELKTGAYLYDLVRVSSGPYELENAISLDTFVNEVETMTLK